jgi:hypothetical protein
MSLVNRHTYHAQAWSESKKAAIMSSRVEGTRAIVNAINACKNPPKTLVCASAVGYYGFDGEDRMMVCSRLCMPAQLGLLHFKAKLDDTGCSRNMSERLFSSVLVVLECKK